MYRSHGMSYAEYEGNFEARIQVEREREKDYRQSKWFTATERAKLL